MTKYNKIYKLYDLKESKEITIEKGNVKNYLKKNYPKISYTSVCHLVNKTKNVTNINGRLINIEDLHKCFTLIDIDSLIEYKCINNKSIFMHFDKEYDENICKYIYSLKIGRQKTASIYNTILCLKGNNTKEILKRSVAKTKSNIIDSYKEEMKILKRLKISIRNRIKAVIKNSGYHVGRTEDKLGCKIQELKNHLENQFTKGMSWENYGEWHVDHINPLYSIDLINPEQYKLAFNYKNTRPLWATTKIAMHYGEDCNYIGNLNRYWNEEF